MLRMLRRWGGFGWDKLMNLPGTREIPDLCSSLAGKRRKVCERRRRLGIWERCQIERV